MKLHLAADSAEFARAFALAAELSVPILIHFQEVDHFPGEGTWATGFATKFEAVLKANPKTTFIGHADAFWANVSADYRNEAAYPAGPMVILPLIPVTTRCRATPTSRATFFAGTRTSSSSGAIVRAPMAAAAGSVRATTRPRPEWWASAWRARH